MSHRAPSEDPSLEEPMLDDDARSPLVGIDLSAWQVPPPPAELADAVLARLREPVPVAAAEAPPMATSKRWRWLVLGAAAAGVALAVWGYTARPGDRAAGELVTGAAQHLELGAVRVDSDPGAELRWRRAGQVWSARQTRGAVTWSVPRGETLQLELGPTRGQEQGMTSGQRTTSGAMGLWTNDARLRVEVSMNRTDARVLTASAATSAAVALATVILYQGHVKATSGGVTVNLSAGDVARLVAGQPPAVMSRSVPATNAVVRIEDCDPGQGPLELYRSPNPGQPEVVAVGVYQAGGPLRFELGEESEPNPPVLNPPPRSLQPARVRDRRTTPHVLVLTSYEPVEWALDLAGSAVTRVLVSGYHASRVTGAGAAPVELVSGEGSDRAAGFAYQTVEREEDLVRADEDWLELDGFVRQRVGAPIAYFAGCYQGSQVVVQ